MPVTYRLAFSESTDVITAYLDVTLITGGLGNAMQIQVSSGSSRTDGERLSERLSAGHIEGGYDDRAAGRSDEIAA